MICKKKWTIQSQLEVQMKSAYQSVDRLDVKERETNWRKSWTLPESRGIYGRRSRQWYQSQLDPFLEKKKKLVKKHPQKNLGDKLKEHGIWGRG